MAKLDPRIEAVRAQYGLEASDFWQIPQNKQWVCKHAALEVVATKANVIWSPPQIIQADTGNGIAVLAVTGTMGDRSEWATGEASPKNNKNAYPWAMAEKRAKDRVVLKLVGIHGLVYSEDEMSDPTPEPRTTERRSEQRRREVANQPARLAKSAARDLFERLQTALRNCQATADFDDFWQHEATVAARKTLPEDWERDLIKMASEHVDALTNAAA